MRMRLPLLLLCALAGSPASAQMGGGPFGDGQSGGPPLGGRDPFAGGNPMGGGGNPMGGGMPGSGGAPGGGGSTGSVAGQWRCQHANRSMTNNPTETWMYQFGLALYPNGTFQAQGSYTAQSAGFAVGFMAQGQWQQGPQGVLARGQERRQDGTALPFSLVLTNIGPGVMSNQYQSPYGRLLTHCQG